MPRQIVRHLAALGGVADMDRVFQVEMRRQSGQIVGIMVHVVAIGGLGRAAMATAVMGDDAVAMIEEEQQLRGPIIGRQRPAMAEHDRLARTPVLVEDLRAVLGGERRHAVTPFACRGTGTKGGVGHSRRHFDDRLFRQCL